MLVLWADVGLLMRGQYREWLNAMQFKHDTVKISWHEQKGWLESHFIIKVEKPTKQFIEDWNSLLKYRQ